MKKSCQQNICLGTVQFGLDYGISNQDGIVSKNLAHKILNKFLDLGGKKVDTAYLYGLSENCLGEYPKRQNLEIITKIPTLKNELNKDIFEFMQESLNRLQLESVYAIMTHSEDDLLENASCYEAMLSYKNKGIVSKIGSSFYNSEKLLEALEKYNLDIIQIPISVFDQEFLDRKVVDAILKSKVEVHVRSIFLQGLIFMEEKEINSYFDPVRSKILDFRNTCTKNNMTELELTYGFIKQYDFIDSLVIGVVDEDQLEESFRASQCHFNNDIEYDKFDFCDDKFRKPSNWRLK